MNESKKPILENTAYLLKKPEQHFMMKVPFSILIPTILKAKIDFFCLE